MLVLSRRPGESIIIGDNIKVMVISMVGNQVRFGIDAPKETSIHRSEIYEKILMEKNESKDKGDINGNKK